MAFDAEAGLIGVGGADVGLLADDVARDSGESTRGELRGGRVQKLDGVEDKAVVQLEYGGEVAAGAIIEDSRAEAKNGLSFSGRVGEGKARGEVVEKSRLHSLTRIVNGSEDERVVFCSSDELNPLQSE